MREVNETIHEDKEVLPGIRKNVFLLGLVSLFNDFSSEMLYPLVPIFLTSVLGAPVAIVGLIEGIAESVASLTKAVSGWISDRFETRRPLIGAGYGLSAIAKPLLGAATGWPMVLGLRFGDRLGKGIRTGARDALIADSVEEKYRGRAFGFHRAMDSTGAVVGPLTALLLLGIMGGDNLRPVFFLALIPGVIGLLLILLVKEHRRSKPAAGGTKLNLRLGMFDRRFRLFLLAIAVFSIGNSTDAFLILRARDVFGDSTFLAVLAYAFYNVVYTLGSTPAGMLSDRIDRRWVLGGGLVIFALVYTGFALNAPPAAIWVLFAVYGLYIAMTDGVGKALIVDMVPAELRGTALGSYATIIGLLTFPASLFGGLLWTYVSPSATFAFGGIMAILAAVLIAFLPLSAPQPQKS